MRNSMKSAITVFIFVKTFDKHLVLILTHCAFFLPSIIVLKEMHLFSIFKRRFVCL